MNMSNLIVIHTFANYIEINAHNEFYLPSIYYYNYYDM